MVTIQRDESQLKTFNTAKKFADEVLFPLMFDYKKYQRQANFGSSDINDSLQTTEEIRDIQRVNGLKAMSETVHDLLNAISSTVQLKGNKAEIEKLKEILATTNSLKVLFYERRDRFFVITYLNGRLLEKVDRDYFEKVKDIVDVCYVNTEMLMTKNKLLFADSGDDYLNDEEIKNQIKQEYIEN